MGKNYNQDDNFDAIIRQKMTNLEGIPAFDAWDSITAELDKEKTPTYQNWWGLSSILLFLLVGGVVFWKKDTIFDNEGQALTSISVNEKTNQLAKSLSQRREDNFGILTKESVIQTSNSTSIKENINIDLNSSKTSNQLNTSNSEISTKNNSNSQKTTLISNKKENSSNSAKRIKAVLAESELAEKKEFKELNEIKNNTVSKLESKLKNKEEKVVEVKDIKLLQIGLIKLKNDLQLLDYESSLTQSKAKEIEIKKATRLTFAFTPLRSYKQLIPNLDDNMIVTGFEDTETLQTRTSFALTLGMERELNDRWEAEWGLNYTRIEQNMNFLYSKKTAPVTILFDTNQNGFDTRPVRKEEKFAQQNTFNYLGIYGGTSYRIFKYAQPVQRIGARFTLATLMNRAENLNSLQESFTAFYKVSHQLSPYWRLNVSPEFNYYFRSTYKKDALLGAKPYTIGLQLGLVRRLGGKKNK